MSDDQLGLGSAVSMALGGMIGGGIYAVLGVVAGVTGAATWLAFVMAGVVAVCAGYSYDRLNRLSENRGGTVTFVQSYVGNSDLAGMVGWTLLFGYVGSMAMYAFAFAEFALGFRGVPDAALGLPLRPVVSVAAVAGFVGLNLLGARSSGTAENVLVALKVGILVAFGVVGLLFATVLEPMPVDVGAGALTSVDPIIGAAISFVAFQGWQLLFYDQERIADPESTIRRAVYLSIPAAVAVYVLVAVVTVNLAPEALRTHPHVALAEAASRMLTPFGLDSAGFALISLSALFSTGSAINATLFSSAHFAKGMLSDGMLPDSIGDGDEDGAPETMLLLLGVVTAGFAVLGSLSGITSFASLAFILVFGGTCWLAVRQRHHDLVNPVVPAVGTAGSLAFFPLMLYNLYTREPETFRSVLVVGAVVVAVELLYFKREDLEQRVAPYAPDEVDAVTADVERLAEDVDRIEDDVLEADLEGMEADVAELADDVRGGGDADDE